MEKRSISIESLHSFIGLLLPALMVESFPNISVSEETYKDGTFILELLMVCYIVA